MMPGTNEIVRGEHQRNCSAEGTGQVGARREFNTHAILRLAVVGARAVEKTTGNVHPNGAGAIYVIRCWRKPLCRCGLSTDRARCRNGWANRACFTTSSTSSKKTGVTTRCLGDVAEGNGDSDLCVFGENVTPNEHKLVRDFVLLDNTYCCSILSADGHQWTDSAMANDYIERSFAGWPRSYRQ